MFSGPGAQFAETLSRPIIRSALDFVLSLVSWPLDIKANAFRFHLVSVEMKVTRLGWLVQILCFSEAERWLNSAAPRLCCSGRLESPDA